ncbi:MAG: hypothetical protein SGBAC_003162 [Bacillariaceae sp.]
MPSITKLKKTKKVKEPKQPSKAPEKEKVLHDSITEADLSDDFFLTTRRVRFSAGVQQCNVMSLEDYSESERKLTWYDKGDKAEINKKHDKIVRRYEMGKRCKRGMTYRGLDAWTDKGHAKFEATINKLLAAVLDEQDKQWMHDYSDPDQLAKASQAVSKRNVLQALRYAEEDEQEAQEAYNKGFKEEAGSDFEDSTRTMSTLVARQRQSRRSSAVRKKERGSEKGDKKKKRSSKRRSSSKKKSEQ